MASLLGVRTEGNFVPEDAPANEDNILHLAATTAGIALEAGLTPMAVAEL